MRYIFLAFLLACLQPGLCPAENDRAAKPSGSTVKERPMTPAKGEVIDKDVIIHILSTPGHGGDPAAIAFSSDAILFDYGSPRLREASFPQLLEIAKALNDPALGAVPYFFVDGHTCNIGTDERNCRLSWDRARNVVQFLVDKGAVPADRLKARGFGRNDPISANDMEENRQQNRRVVLKSGMLSLQKDAKLLCTSEE
jgi:outer membrane protein OmpA-like peptidoglycan-associated protein